MPGVKRERVRRVKGEGAIFQRESDGRWVGRYVKRSGGLAKRYVVYATSKKDVSAKLKTLREQLDAGIDPSRRGANRIRNVVDTWLSDVKRAKKPATYERYVQVSKHVIRHVGDARLLDVNADTVRALDDGLVREGATSAARRSCRVALSAILNVAVAEGLLRRNPCADVDPAPHQVERVAPLTAEEARALIAAARTERFFVLVVLALTAGLREGELFALKRGDVDLKRGLLYVRRSLREMKGGGVVEQTTKTKAGERTIALTSLAMELLDAHMSATPEDSPYLVTAAKGGPLRKSVFIRKEWHAFLERNKLPRWTIRQLRHTATTLLAETGAHPRFVADILGHRSTETTLGTYTHSSAELQRQAVDGLDRLLRETR
jgi:integrase